MMPTKSDCKIIDLKGRSAGILNLEITPVNAKGLPLTEKDGVIIKDPKTELKNKPISFLIKLNATQQISEIYEDIYCQFQMIHDPTIYKTETVRGTNLPNFKFQKQFTFMVTAELINFILEKCLYVQIWGEQKHPKPDQINNKLTTKEWFDKESANEPSQLMRSSAFTNKQVDPNVQRLQDEVNMLNMKDARNKIINVILNIYVKNK